MTVILVTLAYQINPEYELDVGSHEDGPFVKAFHARESSDGMSYRWTEHQSLVMLPGLGAHSPAHVRLQLAGSRPHGLAPPKFTVWVNGQRIGRFQSVADFDVYDLEIPSDVIGWSGDFAVVVESATFVPAQVLESADSRTLGVVLDSVNVQLRSQELTLVTPAIITTMYIVLLVVLVLTLLRQIGLSQTTRIALTSVMLLVALAALVQDRVIATHYSPVAVGLLGIVSGCLWLAQRWHRILEKARDTIRTELWKTQLFLTLALTIGAAHYVESGWLAPLQEEMSDFRMNYVGAMAMKSGYDLYDHDQSKTVAALVLEEPSPIDYRSFYTGYDNPPLTALLFTPFTITSYEMGRVVYLLVNNVFFLIAVSLILSANGTERVTGPRWAIPLMMAFFLEPVYISLRAGQTDVIILMLLALSFWAYKSGRECIAGATLGLAAAVKISPVLLILYFLYTRNYRLVVYALTTLVLLSTLSFALVGMDTTETLLVHVIPRLLEGSAYFENQTLNGFLSRLWATPEAILSLEDTGVPTQVRLLSTVMSLAVLLTLALLIRPARRRLAGLRFDVEFSIVIVAMILISSIAWEHYLTWLLLPLIVIMRPDSLKPLSGTQYAATLLVSLLAYFCIILPTPLYLDFAVEHATPLLSLKLCGTLMIFGVLCYLRKVYRPVT